MESTSGKKRDKSSEAEVDGEHAGDQVVHPDALGTVVEWWI